MQGANGVADEQRNNRRNAALKQGGDVLQQRAGAAKVRNLLLFYTIKVNLKADQKV